MSKSKKYEKWLLPENLVLLEGWARSGMTDVQIAEKMEIGRATYYRWRNDHPVIDEALKKGKEVTDFEVENALLKSAMSGNVAAQIFWLKNRKPKDWKDKIENDVSVDSRQAITIVDDIEDEE